MSSSPNPNQGGGPPTGYLQCVRVNAHTAKVWNKWINIDSTDSFVFQKREKAVKSQGARIMTTLSKHFPLSIASADNEEELQETWLYVKTKLSPSLPKELTPNQKELYIANHVKELLDNVGGPEVGEGEDDEGVDPDTVAEDDYEEEDEVGGASGSMLNPLELIGTLKKKFPVTLGTRRAETREEWLKREQK
eukprot:PhF_6_TR5692/c0_g1_i1/m.8390